MQPQRNKKANFISPGFTKPNLIHIYTMKTGNDKCEQIVALIREEKTNKAAVIIMSLCYDNLFKTLRRQYSNKNTFPDSIIHDAIIEGIMALIKQIKRGRFNCVNDNSPCAFIAKVARNKLSKIWQKEKKNPNPYGEGEMTNQIPDDAEPDEEDITEEYAKIILTKASPKCRKLIMLRLYEGLRFKDIGEKLNITTENARVQYHKCIKKLKDTFGGDMDILNK